MPHELTVKDGDDYTRLKSLVQVGIESMCEATAAAAEIRDRGLWSLEYESWDQFCQVEFKTSARRMYQKMEAAKVLDLLPPGVGETLNEEQLRALKPAADESPEAAVEILESIEAKGGKITGKAIKEDIALVEDPELPTPNQHLETWANDIGNIIEELEMSVDEPEFYIAKDALGRIKTHAKNLAKAIEACRLTKMCPYCNGRGCTQCNSTGQVNEIIFNARAQVLG